jgi:hypothetical protein
LRQLNADLLGEIAGEVALIGGRAVDVVEISVGRDTLVSVRRSSVADGARADRN